MGVHVWAHAAAGAPEDFFEPSAGEFTACFVERGGEIGQVAEGFGTGIIYTKVLSAGIFGAAFAIAVVAGVAVQSGELPVHFLLCSELWGILLLDQFQRESEGTFFEVIEIETRSAAGLLFGHAAEGGGKSFEGLGGGGFGCHDGIHFVAGDAVHLLEDCAAFGGGLFGELERGASGGFF